MRRIIQLCLNSKHLSQLALGRYCTALFPHHYAILHFENYALLYCISYFWKLLFAFLSQVYNRYQQIEGKFSLHGEQFFFVVRNEFSHSLLFLNHLYDIYPPYLQVWLSVLGPLYATEYKDQMVAARDSFKLLWKMQISNRRMQRDEEN